MKDHFGITFPITNPLLSHAALFICAVRLEAAATEPPFLGPNNEGLDGYRPTTLFAEWGPDLGSEQYEHDWIRLITCYNPWTQPMVRRRVFTPGMVTGTWTGRLFVSRLGCIFPRIYTFPFKEIPRAQFARILSPQSTEDSPLVHVYHQPMRFYLRYVFHALRFS